MAVHYFHCTDGRDLIIDRAGHPAIVGGDLVGRARSVADEIKQAVPAYSEWQDWAVHVYDERGEVAIVPFEPEAAAQKTY